MVVILYVLVLYRVVIVILNLLYHTKEKGQLLSPAAVKQLNVPKKKPAVEYGSLEKLK